MNNYQLNRMKMYRAVTGYLKGQESKICRKPVFIKNYDTLLNCINVISRENSVQELSRWGSSPEKKQRRKVILEYMCRISALLSSYAKLTGNAILYAEVRFSPWQLGRVHQVELPIVAMILYDRAEKNLDKMGDYGLTPELIRNFKIAIDAYRESIPFPRSEKVKSISATRTMAESFRTADDALEMLDLLAATVKHSDHGFWQGYMTSRKLYKEGRVKMALKALAVNKADGSPVSRAVFTFVLLEPQRKTSKAGHTIRKKTREQGGFYILHIPPGKYEITVSKTGYQVKKWEAYIDDKELMRMKVEMERI